MREFEPKVIKKLTKCQTFLNLAWVNIFFGVLDHFKISLAIVFNFMFDLGILRFNFFKFLNCTHFTRTVSWPDGNRI